jgi:hypothetical protein
MLASGTIRHSVLEVDISLLRRKDFHISDRESLGARTTADFGAGLARALGNAPFNAFALDTN